MKNIAVILCLLAVAVNICGAGFQDSYEKGNKLYAAGKYTEAIAAYKEAAKHGESPEVYYNLGNACFKSKNIAQAILYYEKALKINPEMEQAQENLAIANSRIADKIEPAAKQNVSALWSNFKKDTGIETFGTLALSLWLAGGLLLGLFMGSRQNSLKKFGFFGGLSLVFLGLVALYLSYSTLADYNRQKSAIITTRKIDVKSAPDKSGTNVFVLHEGAKVHITKTEGEWSEISIASGNVGWVHKNSFEEI